MDENTGEIVKEKIVQFTILAKSYAKRKKKVFIRDINDQFFFCDIKKVDDVDDLLTVKCFAPPTKSGLVIDIPIVSIVKLSEWSEVRL
jgi:hypothetical protein